MTPDLPLLAGDPPWNRLDPADSGRSALTRRGTIPTCLPWPGTQIISDFVCWTARCPGRS